MLNVVKLSSNGGFVAAPGVMCADPVHGTGQSATDAATGGDHTLTVTAGKTYLIMANATGDFIFGLATILTAANVAWLCPANWAITVHIPIDGGTALHYMCLTSGGTIYLTELEQ